MEIGTPVWIPDDTEVWRPGEVVDRAGDGSVTVRPTEGGRRLGFAAADAATQVLRRNAGFVADVDDLILLPHLNEPAILEALCARAKAGKIYTATGPILLAVTVRHQARVERPTGLSHALRDVRRPWRRRRTCARWRCVR